MRTADEKLIINELGSYGYNKQSSRSGLSQRNFMQTKHVHEHFDLIIHVDIKTSKNPLFNIKPFTALIRKPCTK